MGPLGVRRSEREPGNAPLRADEQVRFLEEVGYLDGRLGRELVADSEWPPDVLGVDEDLSEQRGRRAWRPAVGIDDRLEPRQGVSGRGSRLGGDAAGLQRFELEPVAGELG